MSRILKSTTIFFKLLSESFSFAFESVRGDKFRAFLSLLGVTIGIFSIVAVFTAIEGLESNVRNMFSILGTDVVYVDKLSWENMVSDVNGFDFAEYAKRPDNTPEEFAFLQEHATLADMAAMSVLTTANVKNGRNTVKNLTMYGITYDWRAISYFDIGQGRYFTEAESQTTSDVVVIGSNVAEELFPEGVDPINKIVKINGYATRVIGVVKKKGSSMFDSVSYDDALIVPLPYMRNFVDIRRSSPTIVFHRDPNADEEEFLGQLRSLMRNVRRLKPIQEDNFSLNKMSFLDDAMGQVFKVISGAGWVIGGFSILIGAFGIANIMFVSVKERTHIIGIEKAMGAKSIFVMAQFLFEAALLAIVGGLLGILIVWVLVGFASEQFDFQMTLSFWNIMRGVLISTLVGLVAGVVPAMQAARMNPVVAMNKH